MRYRLQNPLVFRLYTRSRQKDQLYVIAYRLSNFYSDSLWSLISNRDALCTSVPAKKYVSMTRIVVTINGNVAVVTMNKAVNVSIITCVSMRKILEKCILLAPETQCEEDEFKCDGNLCLPLSKKCDRVADCADRSDEYNCRKYITLGFLFHNIFTVKKR